MTDNINYALIPAYEPDEKLIALLKDISLTGWKAVVVNDGSGEKFDEIFNRAAAYAKVISYKDNRGKGAAMKKGMEYLLENMNEGDTFVTMDADGQHTVKDASRVLDAARENAGAMILGSRSFTGKVPLRSRLGNAITRFIYSAATGCSVYDTQTGLRAFSKALIPILLEVKGDRYEYEMNMLLDFPEKKIPIIEVGIETIYIDDNSSSHFNAFRDAFRIYKEILKFSLSSISCFAVDYILFAVFTILLKNVHYGTAIANVSARLISSGLNYLINLKIVFRSNDNYVKSAIQYFLLAAGILAANTGILWLFNDVMGINEFVAKLMTEIILFIISWSVQRFVIFRKKSSVKIKKNN